LSGTTAPNGKFFCWYNLRLLLKPYRLEANMMHEELTGKILKGFYQVYNGLGPGFLEKVYQNALALELSHLGLNVVQGQGIKVFYSGVLVGDYFADIIVNELVILELKAAEMLKPEHFAQLTNYLKATDKEIGLLLNFGKSPDFKRLFWTNDNKRNLKRSPPTYEEACARQQDAVLKEVDFKSPPKI
jgi:GxxExxY protein